MVKDHHVAWADRIGLNKQWARDVHDCSDTFGTLYYVIAVRRFCNNIPNIKSGPQLRTIIKQYIDVDLESRKKVLLSTWMESFPQEAINPDLVRQKQEEIELWAAEALYAFVIQTLEDEGFCFYESSVEEDEIS